MNPKTETFQKIILNSNLILKIFSYLEIHELIPLERVCKQFQKCVNYCCEQQKTLSFNSFITFDQNLPNNDVIPFLYAFPIKYLAIHSNRNPCLIGSKERILWLAQKLPNIEFLSISHFETNFKTLYEILKAFESIEFLSICGIKHFNDQEMRQLGQLLSGRIIKLLVDCHYEHISNEIELIPEMTRLIKLNIFLNERQQISVQFQTSDQHTARHRSSPSMATQLKFITLNACPPVLSANHKAGDQREEQKEIREMTSRRRDTYQLNVNYLRQCFGNKSNEELMLYLVNGKHWDELDLKLRFYIVSQLEQYVCQSHFKSYQILPFGSSIAGLGTPNSDLDLVLVPKVSGGQMSREEDRVKLKTHLNLIADLLQYSIPFYSHFSRILRARIPIVKFGFDLAPIDIDLSIELSAHSVHSGVYMSAFLNYCVGLNPCVRDLILLLRQWAKQHKLLKPKNWSTHMVYNGFTSFQLTALVLYFLQKQKIVPPMRQFLTPSSQAFIPCATQTSTLDLLAQFFELVLTLKFDWEAISILNGTTYTTPDPSLPIWMENPFETELNMCRNIQAVKFDKFLETIQQSLGIMKHKDYALIDIFDKDMIMNSLNNGYKPSRIDVEGLFD
ncbi:unnamed protein product [Medioppia subpectinata]|uniref:F-box domain-containing protein n=1 Tax=Medioppia subpectinata TaxID=1979941 RepID=A0A7R9Q4X0_9ACAR|nr:unnamed protein product [Medioppia subpectinata]CAG2113147.1 unnamed protein product [Medioppia subpectinata]